MKTLPWQRRFFLENMDATRIAIFFAILYLLSIGVLYPEQNGGALCGGEDEIPIWILRFEIVDRDTHWAIPNASIEISSDRGQPVSSETADDGIAVYVVAHEQCIPRSGTIEVTAQNYRYHVQEIERTFFEDRDDSARIMLDGHIHNWTDQNQIPSTSELVDKVRYGEYEIGVTRFRDRSGVYWPTYAPACFEYEVEIARIGDYRRSNESSSVRDRYSDNSLIVGRIYTIEQSGQTIHVFPNDLSGGPYHMSKAIEACRGLNRLGYSDWYLPSKEELNVLYINRDRIGGFSDGWYWSSTESGRNEAWAQNLADGRQDTVFKGTTYDIHKGTMRVRCIRKD